MTSYDYFSIAYGALATVSLSLASIVLGVPLGLGLALIRWSRFPVLNQLVIGYVSVIRTCPTVTLALLVFFALPVVGISLDPIPAGDSDPDGEHRRLQHRNLAQRLGEFSARSI